MPVFLTPDQTGFPPFSQASPEGLLALGGDLSIRRLLTAYANGIFPWYDDGTPILWWSPPERCMLRPGDVHVPRSLRRVINSRRFQITLDTAFPSVIEQCARSGRPGQRGTWLVPEMVSAYAHFHEAGYAHSVEAWMDGELVGGLYGVCLGRVFFAESMFYHEAEASKTVLATFARWFFARGGLLIDCQQESSHMLRFGAALIPRYEFLERLQQALGGDQPVVLEDFPGPQA